MQKSKKCPLCKTDWTGNDFVGERAAAPTSKRGSGVGSNVSQRVVQNEVGEEEEDEEE